MYVYMYLYIYIFSHSFWHSLWHVFPAQAWPTVPLHAEIATWLSGEGSCTIDIYRDPHLAAAEQLDTISLYY